MSALEVSVNGTVVGILERFEDERHCFSFFPQYSNTLLEQRPILGQIFEDRFPNPIDVGGPIGWFTNLLPQGAMRRWRAKLYGIDIDDTFQLLEILGDDLPGAVTLRRTESQSFGAKQRASMPIRSRRLVEDDKFRFSLAGAQWKLSATNLGRGLTTTANRSDIHYIAKFHSPEYPGLPLLEFATMNWAKCSGVQTCDFALRTIDDFDVVPEELPRGDGTVYVCRRFDRDADRRFHIEDFAQVFDRPPGADQYLGSYEEIARLLRWLSPKSCEEYLRLIVFNLLCGNGDAHLKNFSLLYEEGRRVVLAPAYDLVSTVVYYPSGRENLALRMYGTDQFTELTRRELFRLATECGMEADWSQRFISETVASVADCWHSKKVREHFTLLQQERIQQHLVSIQSRLVPGDSKS